MTVSPATATPVPEAQPLPGGDEVPPIATDADEDEPRRRRKLIVLLLLLLLFAILMGLAIWYLLFRQAVPLPPIPATQVPHYVGTIYGVDRPVGVATNAAADRIYVAQSGTSRTAIILDTSGNKIADMLPPISTGASHAPVYIAVDPITAEVYVTDRPTASIYIYDENGVYQRTYEPAVKRTGWQPLGITFDKEGNLYVTDLGAAPQEVVEFDREGNVVKTMGTVDGLNFPNGVAVDGNGYVYVTDSNNGRLLVYDKDGKLQARVGRGSGAGNLGLPRGVGVDTAGHVFVMDTSGQMGFVYKQAQAGQDRLEFVGNFGTQGVENGQFLYPTGLAVDSRGRVFVADTANNRVQLWNY